MAKRLRRLNAPSMIALMSILDVSGRNMCTRLADLIEPGDISHGCRDTVACDREALLALADEIVADTEEDVLSEDLVSAWQACEALRDVASKIREACGVVG